MKHITFGFILCLFTMFTGYSQVKDAPQNLRQQATQMGNAFVKRDFTKFTSYTYPLIVKSMGGPARMEAILSKGIQDMEAKGMSFANISFDAPSKIVKSGAELQATVAQHTELKIPKGRLRVTSTLIAISTDNGANWKFIDTSSKSIASLRKTLPNLSPAIVIPAQQPPVRVSS